jgi:hypothetical protein
MHENNTFEIEDEYYILIIILVLLFIYINV